MDGGATEFRADGGCSAGASGDPENVRWAVPGVNRRSPGVTQGIVARAVGWPYSLVHREIGSGRVAWEPAGLERDGAFGE